MTKKEMTQCFVQYRVQQLLKQKDTGSGRAALAQLRRGIGKAPGELPELWGVFLNEMDDALYGQNGEPSQAEWAIYLALTMFALHQQGSSQPVHQEHCSLGKAAAGLIDPKQNVDEERKRIMQRFGPVITAKDMAELAHHLRGLIQLCKAAGVHLDYVQLAADLYDFQDMHSRRRVQLRWGEDFYTIAKTEGDNKS